MFSQRSLAVVLWQSFLLGVMLTFLLLQRNEELESAVKNKDEIIEQQKVRVPLRCRFGTLNGLLYERTCSFYTHGHVCIRQTEIRLQKKNIERVQVRACHASMRRRLIMRSCALAREKS